MDDLDQDIDSFEQHRRKTLTDIWREDWDQEFNRHKSAKKKPSHEQNSVKED